MLGALADGRSEAPEEEETAVILDPLPDRGTGTASCEVPVTGDESAS